MGYISNVNKQKILAIVGPTASGKSAFAVRLARHFGGEIISADSRQTYRGLNIGTGKITKREMHGVPHHLLDVASPKHAFTAHDFIRLARKRAVMIYRNGRLPIVCGGTGFYIDALVGRVTIPNVPPNRTLRTRLGKKTAAQLFATLKRLDPKRAKTIDPRNKVRLIRAIEIAQDDSVPAKKDSRNPVYDVLWIGLDVPKEELERKIGARLRSRIRQGMLSEAKRLHAQGLSYKRMEELGLEYRYLARHLQGKITREEMLAQLERAIVQFAKRQRTYWRRNKDICWLDPRDLRKIESLVRSWLKK